MKNSHRAVRIALAHHWLVRMRGGEKVLEQLCALFPDAPIHTLVAEPDSLSPVLRAHRLESSWLGRIPAIGARYKALLPVFPEAVRTMTVAPGTDLVVSSDASVIKGLTVPEGTPHVCYCHSPPRYLWDLHEDYMKQTAGLGSVGRWVFRKATPRVRQFDLEAAQKVTHFIANSRFVQARIRNNYGRDSTVIYPPVDVDAFDPGVAPEDFYLIVSELVPYKRVDLAVDAFSRVGKRLVIIGDGSEMSSLRARAGSTIEFLGRQPADSVRRHFERCRAFLYPQIEDFGITAVEAQAAGRPVIAFGKGGATDSVIEGRTGVFFEEQTSDCLADAISRFESLTIDPKACRANAERFRPEVFRREISTLLEQKFPALFPPSAR